MRFETGTSQKKKKPKMHRHCVINDSHWSGVLLFCLSCRQSGIPTSYSQYTIGLAEGHPKMQCLGIPFWNCIAESLLRCPTTVYQVQTSHRGEKNNTPTITCNRVARYMLMRAIDLIDQPRMAGWLYTIPPNIYGRVDRLR